MSKTKTTTSPSVKGAAKAAPKAVAAKKAASAAPKGPAAKTAKAPAMKASAKPLAPKVPAVKAGVSPLMLPLEEVMRIRLEHVAAKLQERGFGASIVGTVAEAGELVMKELLPASKARVVSFGGSMTVLAAGLLDSLKAVKKLEVMDTFDRTISPEAMIELRRQALLSDLYLCSVNALTTDGVLMLLDGIGNRTASVQFGPKKVVLLVGRNKICRDIEDGVARIKQVAAPANCVRLNKKTPCVKTGYCMDCKSPDRICSAWSIMTRSHPKERIHVVLINEDMGF